jgi:hypothetical protein
VRKVVASRQQATPAKRLAPRRRASPETLLERQGSYQLEPAPASGTRNPRAVFCDLTVDHDGANLTIGSSRLPSEPDGLADLASAGFEQPQPEGDTRSVPDWFRSWKFTTPATRARASEEILRAVRLAFRVEADAPIEVSATAAASDPDPGGAIVAVLLAIYAAYCLIAGWIVLLAWDVLVPSRAHPAAALWAQLLAPAIALAATLGYAIVIPQLRRRRITRTRPRAPADIDRSMPGVTPIGFLGAPVVLFLLLLATSW